MSFWLRAPKWWKHPSCSPLSSTCQVAFTLSTQWNGYGIPSKKNPGSCHLQNLKKDTFAIAICHVHPPSPAANTGHLGLGQAIGLVDLPGSKPAGVSWRSLAISPHDIFELSFHPFFFTLDVEQKTTWKDHERSDRFPFMAFMYRFPRVYPFMVIYHFHKDFLGFPHGFAASPHVFRCFPNSLWPSIDANLKPSTIFGSSAGCRGSIATLMTSAEFIWNIWKHPGEIWKIYGK